MQVRSELSTKLGIFVQCWRDAWLAARHPLLLLSILPLLLADALWLALLATFPRPPFDAVLVPAWRVAGGEFALHYPEAMAFLPRVAGWGAPMVAWIAGVPAFTLMVAVLPGVFHGDPVDPAVARAARARIPVAWLATLPAALVSVLSVVAADAAAGPAVSPVDALARDLFGLAFLGVGLIARAMFAYTLSAVVLGALGPGAAIARSVTLASRYLGVSLGFVVGCSLMAVPLRTTHETLLGLFSMGPPDLAYGITAIGLVGSALGAWFLVATATRLYLHRYGVE